MIKITSQSAFSLQALLEIIGKHVSQLQNGFSCTVVIIVNGFESAHDDEYTITSIDKKLAVQ